VPLELRWDARSPLPVRTVQGTPIRLLPSEQGPPWLDTGSHEQPFDFCERMRSLCAAIAEKCESLRHLDVSKMLITFTQARNDRRHGLQARVTPLRFREGSLTRRYRGVNFQVQRYFVDGREILYVLSFCLPRFLNQEFDDKFVTLFHELFHIGPDFNGDLRRHEGRYDIHTSSQRRYDEQMAELAREYLQSRPDASRHDFLRLNFAQLQHRHESVVGVLVPRPKVVPLRDAASTSRPPSRS